LLTRARARQARGETRQALDDLRLALKVARGTGDPALFLHVARALLALDGDDQLTVRTRAVRARVRTALPKGPLRTAAIHD
jgi:hypothetical protein